MSNLLTMTQVCELMGNVSAATVYRHIQARTFPRPIKLFDGGVAVRWLEDEVVAALDARKAARVTETPRAVRRAP